MKIKRLRLKNIASIESADIDFEHKVVDAITGEPAPIFIITGDTGTGKSVILDGIAMALYKTTPRIANVSDTQNNTFVGPDGESVSITDISQYTRLGISEKDECFSELTFEGNDGLEYRARLTLGYLRGNTNKVTGTRPLKYKSPQWTLELPDKTSLTKVTDIEPVIKKVVGLDFGQFNRMAMLAQGQFETFLTGKKVERELVLEQLTNTQHFNDYGEAIYRLYKKAKEEKARCEAVKNEAKRNPLSKTDLGQLDAELNALEKEKNSLGQSIEARQKLRDLVNAIETAEQEKQKEEQRQQSLLAEQSSPEYKQQLALVKDWDSTNEERQQLVSLQQAAAQKTTATTQLSELKTQFDQLSSDLEWQKQRIENQEDELYKLQLWIEERKDRDALFTKYGEWKLKMNALARSREKYQELLSKQKTEQDRTEGLKQKEKESAEALKKAADAVAEKQKAIDVLTQKRVELNPTGINAKLIQAQTRKGKLEVLQKGLLQLVEKQNDARKAVAEIAKAEGELHTLEMTRNRLEQEYQAAKAADDAAKQSLTTAKMSVTETLVELRKRLKKEHTETCPLCGQHIDHLSLDKDFQQIITPYEVAQEKTAQALKSAEDQFNNANEAYHKASGELEGRKQALQEQEQHIVEEQGKLDADAQSLGLDPAQDYEPQIADAFAALKSEIEQLKNAQGEAENLQKEIIAELDAKKPLDAEKGRAESQLNTAKNAVEKNAVELKNIQNQLDELKSNLDSLDKEIEAAIGVVYPDWRSKLEATIEQLEHDAQTYLEQKTRFDKDKTDLNSRKETLGTIGATRSEIIKIQPSWDGPIEAAEYPFSRRVNLWNDLYANVSSLTRSISESDRVINECQLKLEAYYSRTGKTEAMLMSLLAQSQQVELARKTLNEHAAALRSSKDAIEKAISQIDEAMAKIGVVQREDLPQKALLEEEIKALNEKLQESVGLLANLKKQKIDYEDYANHLREIEQMLAKAQSLLLKWEKLNKYFGGTKFRTRVQTYILRPLLNNANIYLQKITDRYLLTCSEENDKLSILVHDRYNKNQVRSATVLSGGERFMISLALSLALSSLNPSDKNINILFIDEGFGTLDKTNLESVMATLEKLQEIAGQTNRRVGVISHREELEEGITVKIRVEKHGEGRSTVTVDNGI